MILVNLFPNLLGYHPQKEKTCPQEPVLTLAKTFPYLVLATILLSPQNKS